MTAQSARTAALIADARGRGKVNRLLPHLVQILIADEAKLNFWGDPIGDTPESTTSIHGHLQGFTSEILFGRVESRTFNVAPAPDGEYVRWHVSTGPDGYTMAGGTERVNATLASYASFEAGQEYSLTSAAYHTNDILAPAITLMHLDPDDRVDTEPFLMPVDLPPDAPAIKPGPMAAEDLTPAQVAAAWARVDQFLTLLS